MNAARWNLLGALVLAAAALAAPAARGQGTVAEADLPDPVAKTFRATFPEAELQKLTEEVENGVTIYDFEFKDGDAEKESDIAADGTMLEWTLVIPASEIPAVAMKPIAANSKGAKLGRLERIEVKYGVEDGKVFELPKPVTRYAAEMTKGKNKAEVIVDADGTVFEAPEWVPIEAPPAAKPQH